MRCKIHSSILKETSAYHSADRSGDSGERRKHLKIEECGFLPKAATPVLQRSPLGLGYQMTTTHQDSLVFHRKQGRTLICLGILIFLKWITCCCSICHKPAPLRIDQ